VTRNAYALSNNQAEPYISLASKNVGSGVSELRDDLSQGGPSQHDFLAQSLSSLLSQHRNSGSLDCSMFYTFWTTGSGCLALAEGCIRERGRLFHLASVLRLSGSRVREDQLLWEDISSSSVSIPLDNGPPETHLRSNISLSRDQYQEYQNLAFHPYSAPPSIYWAYPVFNLIRCHMYRKTKVTYEQVLGFENVFVFSAFLRKHACNHPKRIPINQPSVPAAMPYTLEKSSKSQSFCAYRTSMPQSSIIQSVF
jgi:hypothetical protein